MSKSAWLTGNFGGLQIAGVDAERFLQGQLSLDVSDLETGTARLAAWHNPQGRVRNMGWLGRRDVATWWFISEQDSVAPMAEALQRFVLRASVDISQLGPELTVALGEQSDHPAAAIRWSPAWSNGGPQLTLVADRDSELADYERDDNAVNALLITHGIPRLPVAQQEQHVGQMLNLDLLGAISFTKGCFTGQEVLARVHHRGSSKRRLLGWVSGDDAPPAPGQPLVDEAGEQQGQTLCAARTSDGAVLLAVTRVQHRHRPLFISEGSAPLRELALPYLIPDD